MCTYGLIVRVIYKVYLVSKSDWGWQSEALYAEGGVVFGSSAIEGEVEGVRERRREPSRRHNLDPILTKTSSHLCGPTKPSRFWPARYRTYLLLSEEIV